MSTHCVIAKKENGTFKTILCQHDGYEEYAGKILDKNYKKETKVKKLIAKGDLNVLGTTLDKCEHFHDEFSKTRVFNTLAEVQKFAKDEFCHFIYIFENGQWLYL